MKTSAAEQPSPPRVKIQSRREVEKLYCERLSLPDTRSPGESASHGTQTWENSQEGYLL